VLKAGWPRGRPLAMIASIAAWVPAVAYKTLPCHWKRGRPSMYQERVYRADTAAENALNTGPAVFVRVRQWQLSACEHSNFSGCGARMRWRRKCVHWRVRLGHGWQRRKVCPDIAIINPVLESETK
jgi:hypothetical protein